MCVGCRFLQAGGSVTKEEDSDGESEILDSLDHDKEIRVAPVNGRLVQVQTLTPDVQHPSGTVFSIDENDDSSDGEKSKKEVRDNV